VSNDLYEWPNLLENPDDPLEKEWVTWAYQVNHELQPVYEAAFRPLPDDPVELDREVTQMIDGWLPRVASLAVKAEFYLQRAKSERYPKPRMGDNGKPITVDERNAEYEGALAGFRFVRNELDALTRRLADRRMWASSVRKQHGDAQ